MKQYAEPKEQTAGIDAAELMGARLAIRGEGERSVINRIKATYGEMFDPMPMYSKQ